MAPRYTYTPNTFKTFSVQRILWWRLSVDQFDCKLSYIPGKENVLADCFLRLPVRWRNPLWGIRSCKAEESTSISIQLIFPRMMKRFLKVKPSRQQHDRYAKQLSMNRSKNPSKMMKLSTRNYKNVWAQCPSSWGNGQSYHHKQHCQSPIHWLTVTAKDDFWSSQLSKSGDWRLQSNPL